MNEITTIVNFLHPLLDTSTHRQLLLISQTLLAMTGRITMPGISRRAVKGGSYRTIQRFFTKKFSGTHYENTEAINIEQLFEKIHVLGRIHEEKIAA